LESVDLLNMPREACLLDCTWYESCDL